MRSKDLFTTNRCSFINLNWMQFYWLNTLHLPIKVMVSFWSFQINQDDLLNWKCSDYRFNISIYCRVQDKLATKFNTVMTDMWMVLFTLLCYTKHTPVCIISVIFRSVNHPLKYYIYVFAYVHKNRLVNPCTETTANLWVESCI